MSLIRKPDIEVFRDSGTVVAVRGAKTLVQEGAGGVARTVTRLWLTMAVLAFLASGIGAMFSASTPAQALVCAALVGGGVWALWWLWRRPTREKALQDGAAGDYDDVSVPLPDHLRTRPDEDGFRVDYWPKAFVNQATLLFLGGFLLLKFDPWDFGTLSGIGMLMVMRAVLLMSLFFGGRTCVTASADRLTVHTLLGNGSMHWSDIADVAVRKSGRRDWWTPLSTGSRCHIAVTGHHRLGTGKLLIPYKLLGLDDKGVAELIRRVRMRAEVARYGARQAESRLGSVPTAAPSRGGWDSAVSSFDPDAVMARYLAERDQILQAAPAPAGRPVRTFGRKRV